MYRFARAKISNLVRFPVEALDLKSYSIWFQAAQAAQAAHAAQQDAADDGKLEEDAASLTAGSQTPGVDGDGDADADADADDCTTPPIPELSRAPTFANDTPLYDL